MSLFSPTTKSVTNLYVADYIKNNGNVIKQEQETLFNAISNKGELIEFISKFKDNLVIQKQCSVWKVDVLVCGKIKG